MKLRILLWLPLTSLILCCSCFLKQADQPEGMIVFTRSTGNQMDIYKASADGGSVVRLTTHDSTDMLPSWSPDGNKVVFRSFRNGNPEIYTMDANGRNMRRLTRNTLDDCNPKWSPRGDRIAFERVIGDNVSLFTMDTSGQDVNPLTDTAKRALNASWSPDGNRIVYVSGESNYDLFIIDVRTGISRQLTFTPEIQEKFPAWSPDGRWIAYKAFGAGDPAIYRIDTSGQNNKFIRNTSSTSAPAWSPDNGWLLDGGLNLINLSKNSGTSIWEGDEPSWIK